MTDNEIKEFRTKFKYLEKRIKEEQRIVIYRHVSPDFDAFGSQMGLYQWIKDNYPEKEVHYVGDSHLTFVPNLFPEPEKLDEQWYNNEHLAITVDVSDSKRISDNHILKAKEVIKIDHHPLPQEEYRFGDFLIVYPNRPAASEIIALFILSRSRKMKVSKQAAAYLYTGVVGDTGRFLYEDTDSATLRICADLLETGFDKTRIYDQMYATDLRRINILKFCLNNFKLSEKGTCYYVLTQKDMDDLHMTSDEGNLHINTFRNMKGVRCVISVTEDVKNNNFRVSLRSSHTKVAVAANKFNGGGHDYAAGCKLDSLDELPLLVDACDKLE
ncbi:MAG: bifunctional oligoribonuclease/PAP phosphatase NrnA [Bacilli bacterium]